MRYETVLFDLDGTLIDTNELILQSFLYTLKQFFPEGTFRKEDIIVHMGKPLRDMLHHFHTPEHIEDMVEVYREHNLRTHDELVEAFPYVKEVIQQLYEAGIKMGVVTTKQRNTAEKGLELCQLHTYMQTLVSIDDVQHPKPHPQPVLKAMAAIGATPDSTLMVGDNYHDIESARRAGIDSAGVSWSLKGEEQLRSFSPTYMLRDMRDLLAIVGVEG